MFDVPCYIAFEKREGLFRFSVVLSFTVICRKSTAIDLLNRPKIPVLFLGLASEIFHFPGGNFDLY